MDELLRQPDVLLALEPEELASPLLQDLIRRSRGDGQERQYLNRGNYRGLVERLRPARLDEVLRAITEAWGWLEREILIAPDPTQHGGEWFFVTRRGLRLEGQDALVGFRNFLTQNPKAELAAQAAAGLKEAAAEPIVS